MNSVKKTHASAVRSVAEAGSAEPAGRIIYSYDTAFHGFAARLSEAESGRLDGRHGVVAVFPETVYQPQTTRSARFLGLQSGAFAGVWSSARARDDVIVGVVDTGVWPESPSFSDHGMGPIPARWKGACEAGKDFTRRNCNRKVIGARTFSRGYEASMGDVVAKSARDLEGHGSHTASTVAGSAVRGASMLGYAAGTARGMAPEARLAIYKVCWSADCASSDILSAVDRAVADGVDVLSISLGNKVIPYWRDSLAVAAFGAMERGVFVACAAGNGGPEASSLTNLSPWISTVGATR
ncbi:hypothetical protein Taro_039231 [Colocasia esculenta]|uniref:Uncharacterized protein n=1 Tax=Colocasia esculenta TaxID=4460 RepID=A0A843WI89_COLES|nr:hypothetical protein [Colocasia esculenta]